MTMTHTALTAEEEIRRIRGLATARKEHRVFEEDHRETPMFWEHHWESPARRGAEEALACRNVLTSAPPRPGPVAQVRGRLAALARRLGRLLGHATIGRAFSAIDPSVAK
jgi:hypothetical protein